MERKQNAKPYTGYSLECSNLLKGKYTSPIAIHPFFLQDYNSHYAPYNFSAMIPCGACFSFHTVQLLHNDSVRYMFQFSHRTAYTRWFCVVHVSVFTPYSFYAMILCGACSSFRTVQLLRDDPVWCLFQFSHRTASTLWFCVVLVPVFAPYSFYTMIPCGACSSFHTVWLLHNDSVRCSLLARAYNGWCA